jgi:hypothetical protein
MGVDWKNKLTLVQLGALFNSFDEVLLTSYFDSLIPIDYML